MATPTSVLMCLSHASHPFRLPSYGNTVAMEIRVGVHGTITEEYQAARTILMLQLNANQSGVLQGAGLRLCDHLTCNGKHFGVLDSAKQCNDNPACCHADVQEGIVKMPDSNEILLINTNREWAECCPNLCSANGSLPNLTKNGLVAALPSTPSHQKARSCLTQFCWQKVM